tara:strand:- start:2547 stop:4598 length:2052 start_codon:yes stop_codon:yes gene_type:complete
MARLQQYQSNFSLGAIDPLLKGRIDLQQYYSALETAKNVLIEPQGGFSRRAGLKFVTDLTADNASNGVMLIPFEFSTTQNFMIVATAFNTTNTIRFRFYINQTLITNINNSGNSYLDYSTGSLYSVSNYELKKLYFTQNTDTLICVHENLIPFTVVRGTANNLWTIGQISLTKPKAQFTKATSNPSATITPDATDGTVNITASSGVFSSGNVDQYINVLNGFGRARIIEFDSSTVVKVVTETPFFEKDVAIASGAWELETGYEDAWSATRGYPRTCTFHEGRLYFGGSATLPSTLFGSKVGQFFDFKADEGLDDDALQVTLTTDNVNAINALKSGRDLQIFTSGAEFFLPQADLEPITPSNVVVKSATRRGSKANIRPQGAEGGTLFIQRQGKALREMLFSDVELSYVANNISLLSSHLIIDPQKMALRPATDTTEGDLLMIINGTSTDGYRSASTEFAGSMACFMMNKSQNIIAPSFFKTDGDFVDVAVDLDDIYVVVKRTIGGSAKFYLEVFDDDFTTDSAVQKTTSFSGTSYTGHSHLEGKTVAVVRDDIVDPSVAVSSGAVTTIAQPATYMEAGLDFDVEVKTMPFEPKLASGTVQSQKRRILEISPLLFKSQNVSINNFDISLDTFPISGSGGVPTFTGTKKTMGFRGYTRDAQITITQTQPVFLTVLSLDFKVSIGQ